MNEEIGKLDQPAQNVQTHAGDSECPFRSCRHGLDSIHRFYVFHGAQSSQEPAEEDYNKQWNTITAMTAAAP